jgi:N-formylglutamate amidohydrolase
MKLYQKEPRVHSIMIEVRRDLYMDEETGAMLPSFDRIKQDIAEGIDRMPRVEQVA